MIDCIIVSYDIIDCIIVCCDIMRCLCHTSSLANLANCPAFSCKQSLLGAQGREVVGSMAANREGIGRRSVSRHKVGPENNLKKLTLAG